MKRNGTVKHKSLCVVNLDGWGEKTAFFLKKNQKIDIEHDTTALHQVQHVHMPDHVCMLYHKAIVLKVSLVMHCIVPSVLK